VIVLRADFLKSAAEQAGWPEEGAPEVAFCGRSNVGKSSALNALAQRQSLARVSKTPGRTRLLNFFELAVAEEKRSGGRHPERVLRFTDLPGYGFASGPKHERAKWKEMIERYLTRRSTLRAFVVLVDGDLGPQPNDQEMVGWLKSLGQRPLIVATKIDKLSRNRRGQAIEKAAHTLGVDASDVLPFSARERLGVEELWRRLLDQLGLSSQQA
jgi:GTP-binding protein